ncbi:transcription initiation factor TFIID family [Trichomonas vaginalis G3]|uniref:transcription initiation factor TFIID family n=1 Tax=Trichomonas vaginalis (strain ATCC PRA-98 / G3) TaxID=412133 RepID=UPI0021E5CDEF|nr:transcription initiation factor TFIID family [Trichomonas vaginalis G3]KAI5518175.1 transcription initiation factor TFIID family [Trichomonas vaginalis G3]
MSAALTGAQVNFDALGIPVKHNLLQIVADDAESYVKNILRKASILYRNSRAEKLMPKHLNTILESTHEKPLLGYNNSPSFLLSSVGFEQSEIFIVKDPIEKLTNAMDSKPATIPRMFPYGYQWFLVGGVPPERVVADHSADRSNDISRSESFDILRPSSVDTTSRTYSTRQYVADVVSSRHLAEYVRIINQLRDDTTNSRLKILDHIRKEPTLQPLIPYLLQFIINELATHYNEPVFVDIVISVACALLDNEFLSISLFAHALIRIALSILVTPDSSSMIAEEDAKIRSESAYLLKRVIERCESGYTEMRVAVFNYLVKILFNANSTLAAHYGALAGINVLGIGAISKLLGHIVPYCLLISAQKDSRQQAAYIELIGKLIHDMIAKIEDSPDEKDPSVLKAIEKIKKIEF